MTDQHRAGLSRLSGFPLDTMPALDRLAARGIAFNRAYTTAPVSAPARVSLLTGRWPHAHRVRENSGNRYAYFEKDIFDVVKALGYRTGLAGKNHTYLLPEKLDFWREYGHSGGWKPGDAPRAVVEFDKWLARLNHGVAKQPTPFPLEAQLPYRIVSDTMEFIDGAKDAPFLLWVSFPEPHNPYQVPAPYFDMFPPPQVPERAAGIEVLPRKGFKWEWLRRLQEDTYPGYDEHWRRTKSNYLGMLRMLDDQLDRLLRFLEARKLRDNTLIVFLSDHGDYVTDYGLMRKGVEMPEALIRIPMIWAGWGVAGGTLQDSAFVSTADITPTICEAIGADLPKGTQGRSIWPLLQGKEYPKEEFRSMYAEVGFGGLHYSRTDTLDFRKAKIRGPSGAVESFDELNSYTQSGYMKMVRMDDWKLCYDMMGDGQLYNLKTDPHELTNLYGDPSAATEQMRLLQELLAWTIRTQDNLPTNRYEAKWPVRNCYAQYRKKG